MFSEAGGASKPWLFRKVVTITEGDLDIVLRANPIGPAIKAVEIRGLAATK